MDTTTSIPTKQPERQPLSTSAKIKNYIRLKYYQYEVTFGLYMMTTGEKIVVNTIVAIIISALLYGFIFHLKPFLGNTFCRLLYYITGSLSGAPRLCA